jgi:hypothetical protein
MSFATEALRNDYTAAGGTDFTFDFPLHSEDDVTVIYDGVVQTKGAHYTVRSGADLFTVLPASSLPATGFVRFVTAPTSGKTVSLIPVQPVKQPSEYTTEPFPSDRIERDFDKGTMISRTIKEILRRALKFDLTSLKQDIAVDDPVANGFLKYSADGSRVTSTTTALEPGAATLPLVPGDGGTGAAIAGTTKGDLLTGRTGGTFNRKAVGANGTLVEADSAQTDGINWITRAAMFFKTLTTKGDLLVSTGATVQRKAVGADGTVLTADSAQADGMDWKVATPGPFLVGLKLSNNGTDPTNDIDIAVGAATSADAVLASRVGMSLTSAITKRLDAAWVVGTNQGGLDTGTIADATYHVYLIKRVDTGVVDVLFSLSATTPTMPTNYTKNRRIGSIVRTSSAIKTFWQYGDRFMWDTPSFDVNNQAVATGAGGTEFLLNVPAGLDGLETIVNLYVPTSAEWVYIRHPNWADLAGSDTANPLATFGTASGANAGQVSVYPSDTRAIRARVNTASNISLATLGWIDRRGKDN